MSIGTGTLHEVGVGGEHVRTDVDANHEIRPTLVSVIRAAFRRGG
jgi:hypothetical protein